MAWNEICSALDYFFRNYFSAFCAGASLLITLWIIYLHRWARTTLHCSAYRCHETTESVVYVLLYNSGHIATLLVEATFHIDGGAVAPSTSSPLKKAA